MLLGEIRKGFVGTVKGDYCQGKLLDNSSFESHMLDPGLLNSWKSQP